MSMTYSDHICADFQGTSAETWDQELHEHLKLKLDEAQAEYAEFKKLCATEFELREAELTALRAENERLKKERDEANAAHDSINSWLNRPVVTYEKENAALRADRDNWQHNYNNANGEVSKLVKENDAIRAENERLKHKLDRLGLDCGDNSCQYAKNKGGMRTNGGCRCKDKVKDYDLMVQQTDALRGKLERAILVMKNVSEKIWNGDAAQGSARYLDRAVAELEGK